MSGNLYTPPDLSEMFEQQSLVWGEVQTVIASLTDYLNSSVGIGSLPDLSEDVFTQPVVADPGFSGDYSEPELTATADLDVYTSLIQSVADSFPLAPEVDSSITGSVPVLSAVVPALDTLLAIQDKIILYLNETSTGLPETYWAQLWQSTRDREQEQTTKLRSQRYREFAARGFSDVAGPLEAAIWEIDSSSVARLAQANREQALQQAKLEIENIRAAITSGLQSEEVAIGAYKGMVDAFAAEVAGYKSSVEAQATAARLPIELFAATADGLGKQLTAYSSAIDGLVKKYAADVQAFEALTKARGSVYGSDVEKYRADIQLVDARLKESAERMRLEVTRILETAKVLSDKSIASGHVAGQLASAALATQHYSRVTSSSGSSSMVTTNSNAQSTNNSTVLQTITQNCCNEE